MGRDNRELMLSVQGALLGAVTDNLFAVTAGWTVRGGIVIRGYYYGEPTDEDRDVLQVAGTEIAADFWHELGNIEETGGIEEQFVDASDLTVLEDVGFWALIKARMPNENARFTPLGAPGSPTSA
jgi:hypothetical protein